MLIWTKVAVFFLVVFFFFIFLGSTACLAWILGHSYVYWPLRADARANGRPLGFDRSDMQVRWIGVRGRLCSRVLSKFYASFDQYQDVLLLHVGGNDMAFTPASGADPGYKIGPFMFMGNVSGPFSCMVGHCGKKGLGGGKICGKDEQGQGQS